MTATTVSVDFNDPAIHADPYATYTWLRAEHPVCWDGQRWLVSRYDDIVTLLNDPRVSSARTDATFAVLPAAVQQELQPLRTILNSRMLLRDPPEHTRLRTLMTKAFSARAMEGMRPRIQEICDAFMDAALPRGELEIMHDYATLVPSYVIASMLGVPGSDHALFTRWSADQVRVYDRIGTAGDRVTVMRQGQASMLEMKAYLEAIMAARRADPRDDLITMLITVEEQGDRLTSDEVIAMVIAILVGGNNSTAHLIGNAVYTLLRQPDALARLHAEPDLIRPAIEEVMRYESPVQATSRVAKEPIPIRNWVIEPGQNVAVLFGAANRDDAQFPEPDTFVIDRQPNRHLTLAHGPHFCLGGALARAEAQIAVQTAIQRLPNLTLATDHVEWNPGFAFRSLTSLPVTFGNT
jgi:cytochrome P450